MPGKGHLVKEREQPDRSIMIFLCSVVNCVMLDGKKSTRPGVVYGAFDYIGEKTKRGPLKVFTRLWII
jgi:small subunit ribosomal protein S7